MIWISLILNKIPTLFTREILKFFCELFEGQYKREILGLYTQFQGDISIFRKQSKSRQSIEDIIEDVFHLYLTLPYKLGSTKGKKLSPKSKKVFQFAKALAHKTKGGFLLEKLFYEVSKTFKLENNQIGDSIYSLVEKEVFLPISQEKPKKRFPFHF